MGLLNAFSIVQVSGLVSLWPGIPGLIISQSLRAKRLERYKFLANCFERSFSFYVFHYAEELKWYISGFQVSFCSSYGSIRLESGHFNYKIRSVYNPYLLDCELEWNYSILQSRLQFARTAFFSKKAKKIGKILADINSYKLYSSLLKVFKRKNES